MIVYFRDPTIAVTKRHQHSVNSSSKSPGSMFSYKANSTTPQHSNPQASTSIVALDFPAGCSFVTTPLSFAYHFSIFTIGFQFHFPKLYFLVAFVLEIWWSPKQVPDFFVAMAGQVTRKISVASSTTVDGSRSEQKMKEDRHC